MKMQGNNFFNTFVYLFILLIPINLLTADYPDSTTYNRFSLSISCSRLNVEIQKKESTFPRNKSYNALCDARINMRVYKCFSVFPTIIYSNNSYYLKIYDDIFKNFFVAYGIGISYKMPIYNQTKIIYSLSNLHCFSRSTHITSAQNKTIRYNSNISNLDLTLSSKATKNMNINYGFTCYYMSKEDMPLFFPQGLSSFIRIGLVLHY